MQPVQFFISSQRHLRKGDLIHLAGVFIICSMMAIRLIRKLVLALVAVALLGVPLHLASPVVAAADMAMSDENCPEKQSCCDMDKSDCEQSQACFAQCGGTPVLAMPGMARHMNIASESAVLMAAVPLMPRTTSPLRRPPRA